MLIGKPIPTYQGRAGENIRARGRVVGTYILPRFLGTFIRMAFFFFVLICCANSNVINEKKMLWYYGAPLLRLLLIDDKHFRESQAPPWNLRARGNHHQSPSRQAYHLLRSDQTKDRTNERTARICLTERIYIALKTTLNKYLWRRESMKNYIKKSYIFFYFPADFLSCGGYKPSLPRAGQYRAIQTLSVSRLVIEAVYVR